MTLSPKVKTPVSGVWVFMPEWKSTSATMAEEESENRALWLCSFVTLWLWSNCVTCSLAEEEGENRASTSYKLEARSHKLEVRR